MIALVNMGMFWNNDRSVGWELDNRSEEPGSKLCQALFLLLPPLLSNFDKILTLRGGATESKLEFWTTDEKESCPFKF